MGHQIRDTPKKPDRHTCWRKGDNVRFPGKGLFVKSRPKIFSRWWQKPLYEVCMKSMTITSIGFSYMIQKLLTWHLTLVENFSSFDLPELRIYVGILPLRPSFCGHSLPLPTHYYHKSLKLGYWILLVRGIVGIRLLEAWGYKTSP